MTIHKARGLIIHIENQEPDLTQITILDESTDEERTLPFYGYLPEEIYEGCRAYLETEIKGLLFPRIVRQKIRASKRTSERDYHLVKDVSI